MTNKAPRKLLKNERSPKGQSLIEMLVAIVFGAIIATTLTSMLSQTMRQSTTSQNQQTANSIAQELIDYSRSMDYVTLAGLVGTYELLPTQAMPGRPPVIIDLSSRIWSKKSIENAFKGSVTYSIQQGASPTQLLVSVLVSWNDSSATNRQIVTATVINQYGTRYWH